MEVAGGGNLCSECDSSDVIIKKARKCYCRNCWKYRCEFQFRKRLFEFGRPAKGTVGEVFRPTEQVLICYDGSPSSVALINLALNSVVLANQRVEDSTASNLPFPFKFVILVILESERNGSPGVEGRQKQHLHSLLKWTQYALGVCDKYPFTLITTCLELSLQEYRHNDGDSASMPSTEVPLTIKLIGENSGRSPNDSIGPIHISEIDKLTLPFDTNLDIQLAEIRKSFKTKTDDKDCINVLKRNLVNRIADQLKVSKVLLPEDQTTLAVKMFTMMSLGRGRQVADEMGFTSSVDKGIVVARPLIDFSDDDLRAYLQTLGEQCTDGIVSSKVSGKRKLKIDSVERQCDDFITNLQQGFPSTVSTLTRIGSKLQSASNQLGTTEVHDSTGTKCQFCKRVADIDQLSSPSENALCYGCRHFIIDDTDPEKSNPLKKLLRFGNPFLQSNDS